jgi:esterase/lipase
MGINVVKFTVFSLCVALCACASDHGGIAAPEALQSSGWQNVTTTLKMDSFDEYAQTIRQEVAEHRFNADNDSREREIHWVSPRETPPAKRCNERVSGIALLVHGLSGSAFTMRDIAQSFSSQCFLSRIALLPGHGTRPGDLKHISHDDWLNTVDFLVEQAASEHEVVVVVGFSLGSVLTMSVALDRIDEVDAIVAFAPAYYLSSYSTARWTPWLKGIFPWIDKDAPDDLLRYEAMPTNGVAQTVKAMQTMHDRLKNSSCVRQPWMIIQSLDDNVIVPEKNAALLQRMGQHEASRILNFYSMPSAVDEQARVDWVDSRSDSYQVVSLTHMALPFSPNNLYYGASGEYRSCGASWGRDSELVARCETTDSPVYGNLGLPNNIQQPTASATFNPAYNQLDERLGDFLANLTSSRAQCN